MMLVGLTGGFGTGKTTVATLFARAGAGVVDVDSIAHALSAPKKPLYRTYVDLFGSAIVQSDGRINRKMVAARVFADATALQKLNRAAHPVILKEMGRQIKRLKRSGVPYVVVDLPLLFEGKLESQFDLIIVVSAKQSVVVKRLSRNRKLSAREIKSRIRHQFPLSRKCQQADIVLDNNKTLANTRRQVDALAGILLAIKDNS